MDCLLLGQLLPSEIFSHMNFPSRSMHRAGFCFQTYSWPFFWSPMSRKDTWLFPCLTWACCWWEAALQCLLPCHYGWGKTAGGKEKRDGVRTAFAFLWCSQELGHFLKWGKVLSPRWLLTPAPRGGRAEKGFPSRTCSAGTPHYLIISGPGHVCSSMMMRHRATSDQGDLSAAEEVIREEKADLLAPAADI